jgi:hypothetical protein
LIIIYGLAGRIWAPLALIYANDIGGHSVSRRSRGRPERIRLLSIGHVGESLVVLQISDYSGISELAYTTNRVYESIKKQHSQCLCQFFNALFEKVSQGNVTAMIYSLKVRDQVSWG